MSKHDKEPEQDKPKKAKANPLVLRVAVLEGQIAVIESKLHQHGVR